MVISDLSIACFAALSASLFPLTPMCAGTLHELFSLVIELCQYVIYLIQDWGDFLCCSQWPAVYILPILCPLFHCCHFGCMNQGFIGQCPSSNNVRENCCKPILFSLLFHPSFYASLLFVFFFVLQERLFSLVDDVSLYNKKICNLTTMGLLCLVHLFYFFLLFHIFLFQSS